MEVKQEVSRDKPPLPRGPTAALPLELMGSSMAGGRMSALEKGLIYVCVLYSVFVFMRT